MYLGAVVAGRAGVYLYQPRLVLIVYHEIVAVELPRFLAVFHQVLGRG